MDPADLAQEGIDNALADALEEHHRTRPGLRRDKACFVSTTATATATATITATTTTCSDCEEEIDPRRLAAHPAAIRCIDCQEEFERRRRP